MIPFTDTLLILLCACTVAIAFLFLLVWRLAAALRRLEQRIDNESWSIFE